MTSQQVRAEWLTILRQKKARGRLSIEERIALASIRHEEMVRRFYAIKQVKLTKAIHMLIHAVTNALPLPAKVRKAIGL